MKNTFGSSVSLTLFGESHGEAIGAVLDGLAPGIRIDENYIAKKMHQRMPYGKISTARREDDNVEIVSGVYNGFSTGTPIALIIKNADMHSKDYSSTRSLARPGHADFTAFCKYHGFEDFRGGGHFSGRITAPVVAAGAILLDALREKGIYIGTHIKKCAGISDRDFDDVKSDLIAVDDKIFSVLDTDKENEMKSAIEKAAENKDSVGGILETAVYGIPTGIGEPWFDSLESVISHAVFGMPAVKGIEFGMGFELADMLGSQANDPFVCENGKISTLTNNNGGINGGISNGLPIVFRTAVKPTPSIFQKQTTVDFIKSENAEIELNGRHDPCIVHRARVVQDSLTALVVADMLALRFGTDYLATK
ncbi:MAG: chorismate synthase [Oscillospiraceae bacterium]|nr:chorismate synthase [Oscillospiraceae bacterium]